MNIGGRWAVLPALAACLGGLLATLLHGGLLLGVLFTALGLAGVVAAVAVTASLHTRSGRRGAPDWVLPFEAAVGLPGAIASYIEGAGPFQPALQASIEQALHDRRARPAYALHFGGLAVALFLCLLPVALALAPEIAPPPQVADAPLSRPQAAQQVSPAPEAGGGEEAAQAGGKDEAAAKAGGGSGAEKPQPQPGGQGREPGPAPERRPQPSDHAETPTPPGDEAGQPQPPKDTPPPPDEINTNDLRVMPEAGDGETRREQRSRWRYNPAGESTATPRVQPGAAAPAPETAGARQRVTTREKRVLEELARRLGE